MAFDWLNDESEQFLSRGYLRPGQTGQERVKEIAEHFGSLRGKEKGEKFFKYASEGYYSFASPVWSNYGDHSKGYSVSCFGSYIEDSVPSILETVSEVGAMSQKGGGCSGYLGNIRPRGSKVNNGRGSTSGSVHFLELFETLTEVISQSGVRRGFFTPYLDAEHGDIEEFIAIGSEGHPVQTLTTGVNFTDEFMERVKNKDRNALATWAKWIMQRKEVGYPYGHWLGNVNNNTVDVYRDKGMKIVASNMCVAPETKVLTDKGFFPIVELAGQEVMVWNGAKFTPTTVHKTGEDQPLVRVKTSGGADIECTPYHKFYVKTGYGKNDVVEKRASELLPGDKLIKMESLPVIQGDNHLDNAYANGFYSGDGCLTSKGKRIYLYEAKRTGAIKKRLGNIFRNWYVQENYDREYGHSDELRDKFFVPTSNYTVQSRLDWFAGICDSDGTVSRNGKTQSIQICSVNKAFLEDIQMMLQTLGVNSTLNLAAKEGMRALPANDGSGEAREFFCKESWRILVGQHDLDKLIDLGIEFSRLSVDESHKANRACNHFNKVVSVEDEGRTDDTYCFTERERHMGVFNGILAGNCNEIELPSSPDESFVCVLSAMNIMKWDEWKDTDAVEIMTEFLDTVVDDFINKLERERDSGVDGAKTFDMMKRAYRFAKRHRALGIGSLGLADYLMSKGIPFESDEAEKIDLDIHKHIQDHAWKASKDMASRLGEPEVLEGYGRRNATLTALMPTKSSSFILGQVSQTTEPRMSNYYTEDLAKTKYMYKNPYLLKLLQKKGADTRQVWKSIADHDGSVQHLVPDILSQEEADIFKTFGEINPYVIVDRAASRQKFVDQGQSLNLMIGPKFTPKEISQLYIHAWESGIKGVYYSYNTNSSQELARKADCPTCSI